MKRIVTLILTLSILFCLTSCGSPKTKTSDIEEYYTYLENIRYSSDYMPKTDALGTFSNLCATYNHDVMLFFDIYSVGLFLSYDAESYSNQLDYIATNYAFYPSEDENLESDCDATVGGYKIRLVKDNYPNPTYKMGLLIGMDDSKCKICYLFYFDMDLDYLDDLDDYIDAFFYMQ